MDISTLFYLPQFTAPFIFLLGLTTVGGYVIGETFGKKGNLFPCYFYLVAVGLSQMVGHYAFHLW